jgi:Tol biopolymer transport system component
MLRFLFLFALTLSAQIRIRPLVRFEVETSEPSLSPDGKTQTFQWCKADYTCEVYSHPRAGGPAKLFVAKDAKGGTPDAVRWSPDGKKIAVTRFYSHYNTHLMIRDVEGGPEQDLGVVCHVSGEASWSPDSKLIAASVYINEDLSKGMECRPMLFSIETGQRIHALAPRGQSAAFSPDGKVLAYADGPLLRLRRLNASFRPVGRPATLLTEARDIGDVFWTRDGKQLVYRTSNDIPYWRVSLTSGAKPQPVTGLSADVTITQILSSGNALGTESRAASGLWRADLRETPPKMEKMPDNFCASGVPECSLDGKQRAYFKAPDGVPELWVSNADGTNERRLLKPLPGFSAPSSTAFPTLIGWSPDGNWIGLTICPAEGNSDLRSELYVIPATGGNLKRLGKEAYALDGATWSPDSKSLFATQGRPLENRRPGDSSPLVRVNISDGKFTSIGAEGIWPHASLDGKLLYFFSSTRRVLSWTPIAGGPAQRLEDAKNLLWFSYAVGPKYLYLFQQLPDDKTPRRHKLLRLDPETKQSTDLLEIPFSPRFASLSADGNFLYMGQQDDPKRRAVLIQGLKLNQ